MAYSIPKVSYKAMSKEGTRHYQGLDEAVYRNIDACKNIATITRSSYGPNGMKKIVVNHLDKLFVTKDAATILRELEVVHPAAKILVMAAKMAEQEVGDGTNFVIQFAASLLDGAAELLNFGISPCEIVDVYRFALKKSVQFLDELVCDEVTDIGDVGQVYKVVKSVVSTKQFLHSDMLSKLVTDACIQAKPLHSKAFNVDSVRTVKILGSGGVNSSLHRGLVIKTDAVGDVSEITNAKVAVFSTDFDLMNTETKGTVLLNTANELLAFTKGEESALKTYIEELKRVGCNMVVCSGKVADQALDFANRLGIMVVRIMSKFDIQRLCRAIQACTLACITVPTPEQLGHCDKVYVQEIGASNVVVFAQEREDSAISTIVIRGSSDNVMDDLELSIDDGVNCYKSLSMNGKLLPGCGACEMALAEKLDKCDSFSGLEKHILAKYCDALKNVVRCIAENNGLKVNEITSKLVSQHASGKSNMGIDIEENSICEASHSGIYDLLFVKTRCLQLAVDAVMTLLSVDHIVVARPAGGPVPRQNPNWDED